MISGINPWFPILSIKILEYALVFQNAFIDSIIEQAALKTRKLFLFQLLHINLDVNLVSLHVSYMLSLYWHCFFMCVIFMSWIMWRSLTSQIITITTKSDNVIVEDWSKKNFIYFFHETEKCRAKTRQLSVSSYFLSVLASF